MLYQYDISRFILYILCGICLGNGLELDYIVYKYICVKGQNIDKLHSIIYFL